MHIAAAAAVAAAAKQAGDLDPRHHHRVPHGGGGGEGGGGAQQEADEQQHHHHRLLQLHQEVQDQEPPPVPVFQLQHLQAAAVRQRGLSAEYALLAPMGDAGQSHHHHGFQPQLLSFGGVGQHHLHQFTAQAPATGAASPSRLRRGGGEIVPVATSASHSRVRGGGGGGEIVAVQGGHIVRSTGRKDRHSKVCTARGPRDRRVRLSAHTAIQFYDVQDRLGYDRPSKAVDWLIKNAKDAIDKLDVLPAWQPTAAAAANAAGTAPPSSSTHPDSAENSDDQAQAITVAHMAFDFPGAEGATGGGGGTGFLPPSLDSDSIADTIKSFFPVAGTGGGEASSSTAAAHSSGMGFQSYTPDLLSRTGSHSQELRLSLQSLPDPMFHHHHHHHQQQQDRSSHGHGGNGSAQQALFPGAANYSFGGGAALWAEQAQSQRMLPWNVPDPGGGYPFNVSQQAAHMQAALGGQSQFFFQRGPLQSSNQPSERGWPETVEADNPMHHHQGGLSPIGFAPGIGFSGFRIPTRIQGDEEHNGGGGNGDKPPPSVSSASHH